MHPIPLVYKKWPLQLDMYLFTQRPPSHSFFYFYFLSQIYLLRPSSHLDVEVCFFAESLYLSTPVVLIMVHVSAKHTELHQTFPAGDQPVESIIFKSYQGFGQPGWQWRTEQRRDTWKELVIVELHLEKARNRQTKYKSQGHWTSISLPLWLRIIIIQQLPRVEFLSTLLLEI